MCQLNWTKYHANQLPQMSVQIDLDDLGQESSYSVGDVVSGHVRFNISKPFYTYAVRVAVEGCAVVKQDDVQRSDTFLNIGTNVYGRGEKIALPAGKKNYKFSLQLAPTGGGGELPGTFRDSNGFILYQVVVYLQQELRSYKQAEKVITVRSYHNLSHDKGLLNPVVQQKMAKSPSMLQFLGFGRKTQASTGFGVSIRLNRSGYLLGEQIPFELEFKNLQDQQVASAKVSLLQKTVYTGPDPPAKVTVANLQTVETKETQNVWTEHLETSDDIRVSQIGIIEISYTLKVEVILVDEEPYLLEVPIKIGTHK